MSGTITATPPGVTPYPRPAVGWYATVVLALLYWFSVLDRFIIGLMVDPIKRDLGLTDLQFGILHGSAFVITFSVVGLLTSAVRRVGKVCFSTCRSWWSPYHVKKTVYDKNVDDGGTIRL